MLNLVGLSVADPSTNVEIAAVAVNRLLKVQVALSSILTPQQVAALSPTQLAAIAGDGEPPTPEQLSVFAAMPAQQVAALTPEQIQALLKGAGQDQRASVLQAERQRVSAALYATLSPAQIAVLSPDKISVIAQNIAPEEPATTSQLPGDDAPPSAPDKTAQLVQLARLDELSPQAVAALTPGELAALLGAGPIAHPPAPGKPSTVEKLVVDSTLNGTHTDQLLTVYRDSQGTLYGVAGELRGIRIRLNPTLPATAPIRLESLPGLRVRIDDATQTAFIDAPDALMVPYDVNTGNLRTPLDLESLPSLRGAVLNYDIYTQRGAGSNYVAGTSSVLAMAKRGVFQTGLSFTTQSSAYQSKVARLDTNFILLDDKRVRSYTVGDFNSNATDWSSSIRLGGIQIASDYQQRPDIVTEALPQFSGSAALPSTLDLYVNQQRIFSGDIPSGPFDVKSLPQISGGNVTVVTTDSTGKQVRLTRPFYSLPGQLAKGVFEYSLDVGAPRIDYGQTTLGRYDHTLFLSASSLYGLNDRLTLQGRTEESADGLTNLGFGVVHTLGGWGGLTASLAAGRYHGLGGEKYSLDAETSVAGIHVFGSTQRTIGNYSDLARVSQLRSVNQTPSDTIPTLLLQPGSTPQSQAQAQALAIYENQIASTATASIIDQAGLALSPKFLQTSISVTYNRLVSTNYQQQFANLTLSRAVARSATLFVNAFKNFQGADRSLGVFAMLSFSLGHNAIVSTTVQHTDGKTGYTVQASKDSDSRQDQLSWSASDTGYPGLGANRSAEVTYRAAQAQLRAQIYQYGGQVQGTGEISGSIVAAGGGLFFADRVGSSFAIVQNAGPGSVVEQGGVATAKADYRGRAFLPSVIPYSTTHFTIDPTNLADGWDLATTEIAAGTKFQRGILLDFGATRVHAAIVTLTDAAGKPIPPGYNATTDSGENAEIGYDGAVYFSNLKPQNRVRVDRGVGGICSASFAYRDNSVQTKIGPIACI